MSDTKLVKTIMDAAVLTGLTPSIGWIAKKVVKENFTADPSDNVMNYAKFTAVLASSIALKDYLEDKKSLQPRFRKKILLSYQWHVLFTKSPLNCYVTTFCIHDIS